MAGPINISVKLFERLLGILLDAKRVRETEVDFLKKEYASFLGDDVHGNPKTYMNLKNMTKLAKNVLTVSWLHTSKPANTRSCGIL